jgi:hypothetical protein
LFALLCCCSGARISLLVTGTATAIDDSALILKVRKPAATPLLPHAHLCAFEIPLPRGLPLTALYQWIQDQKPSLPMLFPPSGHLRGNVDEMCSRFDETLGPAVRVWVYSHLIGKRATWLLCHLRCRTMVTIARRQTRMCSTTAWWRSLCLRGSASCGNMRFWAVSSAAE